MDFNSLQAQREACEAYIRSQKSEGWRLVATAYDDGGISGGTMDRPALARLLADIEEGRVDVVVVYKVDRLTRSLAHFSKMVDVFDRRGVSFVAVTQQFNTTTSMGRLTLNVLLSFAQFEREVTGERIRDKIAASKRKGMWMGGGLPHGYRVKDRKLVMAPEQAAVVRLIYNTYLEVAGIRALAVELKRQGISRLAKPGRGDSLISRGALYALLRNPVYAGLIRHKNELFPGQHEAIVDRQAWDEVQRKLDASNACRGRPRRKSEVSPLAGKIFGERGERLTPSHATKGTRRYRYYVSHSDLVDTDRLAGVNVAAVRLPGPEIEQRVAEIVRRRIALNGYSGDSQDTRNGGAPSALAPTEVAEVLSFVVRVDVSPKLLTVTLRDPAAAGSVVKMEEPIAVKRRGRQRRIALTNASSRVDTNAVKAISLGYRFWAQLGSAHGQSAQAFAAALGVDNRYLGRALSLAFLAPDLARTFVSGRQPAQWSAKRLLTLDALPLRWDEQRVLFLE